VSRTLRLTLWLRVPAIGCHRLVSVSADKLSHVQAPYVFQTLIHRQDPRCRKGQNMDRCFQMLPHCFDLSTHGGRADENAHRRGSRARIWTFISWILGCGIENLCGGTSASKKVDYMIQEPITIPKSRAGVRRTTDRRHLQTFHGVLRVRSIFIGVASRYGSSLCEALRYSSR